MIASLEMIPVKPVFRRASMLSGRPRTRRAIFRSREDAGDSLDFVKKEQLALAAVGRERWNFDFQKGLPVSGGRYLWEACNPQRTSVTTECDVSEDLGEVSDQSATTQKCIEDWEKTKQTKLSDFWSTRKRHISSPHPPATTITQKTVLPIIPGDAEVPAKVQRTSSF